MAEQRSIQPGDRIRDNDPLTGGRRVGVVREAVDVPLPGGRGDAITTVRRAVVDVPGGRETMVRVDRIHTDNRPRKSGWSLVAP